MAESQERLRNRPYIGDRDGGMIMDFDGRVRRCTNPRVVERVSRGGAVHLALRVEVDPPLPGSPDPAWEHAVKERGMAWVSSEHPTIPKARDVLIVEVFLPRVELEDDDPVAVSLYGVIERDGVGDDRVSIEDTRYFGKGVAARLPELLPSTPERRFNEMFGLLCRFVFREGHLDVPLDHREDGQLLGLWLADSINARRQLSREWRDALESIPGWKWPALRGPIVTKEEMAARPEARLCYPGAVLNVDAETRAGARRGEVLARRTRSTRRTKYALVALVVIAFVVNLFFKDDSSEAWTVLGNLDGVVFWLALFALPVALFVEQAQAPRGRPSPPARL